MINKGDKVLINQNKSTARRLPFDSKPFHVVKVKGSQLTMKRENQTRNGDKGHIRLVKERLLNLIPSWQQKAPVPISNYGDFDIDVNWTKISGQAATNHAETPSTASTKNSDDSQERSIVQQDVQEHISPDISDNTSDNTSHKDLFQVSQEEEDRLIPLPNAIGIICESQTQSNEELSLAPLEGYLLRRKCKLVWNPKMNDGSNYLKGKHVTATTRTQIL